MLSFAFAGLDKPVKNVLSREITDLLQAAGFNPCMGESAPRLLFRDAEGTVGSLDRLRGKVVLVAFWGTTCPPCIAELPELESLADRYDKSDLVVLPVCLNDTGAATAYDVAKRHAPRLPVYVDPEGSVHTRFEVRNLPQAVLIDREGRMLGRFYGASGWAGTAFERLLSAGLGLPSPVAADAEAAGDLAGHGSAKDSVPDAKE